MGGGDLDKRWAESYQEEVEREITTSFPCSNLRKSQSLVLLQPITASRATELIGFKTEYSPWDVFITFANLPISTLQLHYRLQ